MTDQEAETSSSGRPAGVLIVSIAMAAALFHLYASGISPFTALIQRPVHLALMSALGFLGVGVLRERAEKGETNVGRVVSLVLLALTLFSCVYLVWENEAIVRRIGAATSLDLVAGAIAIVVVLELARRTTGWGLVSIALLALVYAWAGPYLPGALAHRGYGPSRLIEHLYLSTEGLWGVPLGVSADFVYLFVLFGALLEVAGGGALLVSLANRVAGRSRGGPAKTAAVASAFMGSLSGSAVANVVTTGAFTIPMMKRAGFKPYFAGAVEAAASTGGQLMPPVMGAGAFILATWTNIPYVQVAAAALIPAILYYGALFMAIHFRAMKEGIEPSEDLDEEPVLPRLHLLLPLALVVTMLVIGRSPARAAFWGVVSGAILAMVRKDTRLDRGRMSRALVSAAAGTVQVATACATAGIIVGVASLTGIGLRMSELIVALSGGHLLIALILTAFGSIILGMGLPTTAAYIVLAALGAPALTDLGVPLLPAHMFIFYFGCISNVTPPVSLAAYAAAGIARAPSMKTAFTAMGLASTGFIVPFMFVYGPALLLQAPVHEIILATLTALVGVTGLGAAVVGYARAPLPVLIRLAAGAASGALILPGLLTDGLGLLVLGLVFAWRPKNTKNTLAGEGATA